MIRFRTNEPDFSDVNIFEYDWENIYRPISESLPHDSREPLGRYVTLSHYVDANLMHCLLTRRSVTGVLHFINQTPIDWFSKKQATVETATYGSEFIAARTCVEQAIDLRNTLRYLGVPIRGRSYMFGDNESFVNSSSKPHAKLHKRHNALSFHRVREAVAAKLVSFNYLLGSSNPADILSKHWSHAHIQDRLRLILFWKGDASLFTESE